MRGWGRREKGSMRERMGEDGREEGKGEYEREDGKVGMEGRGKGRMGG